MTSYIVALNVSVIDIKAGSHGELFVQILPVPEPSPSIARILKVYCGRKDGDTIAIVRLHRTHACEDFDLKDQKHLSTKTRAKSGPVGQFRTYLQNSDISEQIGRHWHPWTETGLESRHH